MEYPIRFPTPEDIDEWEEQQITEYRLTLAASYPKSLLMIIAELVRRKMQSAEDLSITIRGLSGLPLQKRRQCLKDLTVMLSQISHAWMSLTVEDLSKEIFRVALERNTVAPAQA